MSRAKTGMMFVRRKPNKSGSVNVQVVQKTKDRRQVVIKTIGSASDESEIARLETSAREYIHAKEGPSLPNLIDEVSALEAAIGRISNAQVQVIGPELVFGALYDRIGYGSLGDEMFRHLVICRLFNPGSKLKTADYPERYLHKTYSVDHICVSSG